ncbi:uncharacterized protein CG4449-like isoform X2 [Zootermopsis nevadensis]|uniref:uncharacterized protein CG4449-like isoform X2 n=1 Tax=Zootermopsis nevadensis TaxID=136037 RepID=UPI000B8EBF71|nr:uncharacterized protein CG4449-like isoform X2 [Zootermopsis nevadensis]
MEDENDFDYGCDLYTTAGTYYKAIKESLHLDYDALLKEAEEIQSVKTCELDDLKPKGKRGTKNPRGRRKATKLTDTESHKNVTHEQPETLEELNDCQRARSTRGMTRATKRAVGKGAPQIPPNQEHIIGTIIITDSPERPKDDHILIGSDSETEVNISLTGDDDNYEMLVKVWWKFVKFDKFTIRRFQKLAPLFEHYSQLENVPQSQVLLTLNDVQVHPNDTPDSLKLTVANIIEGGVTTCIDMKSALAQEKLSLGVDEIELKIQRKGHKERISMRIKKNQKMRVLMFKCAEYLELPEEKLKFSFDGESLNPNETPVDLDLEGGECIDLYVSEV